MGEYVERGRNPPHAITKDDPPGIALIKQEHQMFRALFDFVELSEGQALTQLVAEICVRLTIHMLVEEDVLYPALKPVVDLADVDEGIVEHDVARGIIVKLVGMTGREELYKPTVHVLGEETIHHIDEEDRKLLVDARTAWEQGKIDLVLLGNELLERQQELYNKLASIGSEPEPEVELVGDQDEFPNPAAPQQRGTT